MCVCCMLQAHDLAIVGFKPLHRKEMLSYIESERLKSGGKQEAGK